DWRSQRTCGRSYRHRRAAPSGGVRGRALPPPESGPALRGQAPRGVPQVSTVMITGARAIGPTFAVTSRARWDPSLDHLVGAQKEGLRDREIESLSGLQVDYEIELERLLDRQLCWRRALEDLIDVSRGAVVQLGDTGSVGKQPTRIGQKAVL